MPLDRKGRSCSAHYSERVVLQDVMGLLMDYRGPYRIMAMEFIQDCTICVSCRWVGPCWAVRR